MDLTKGFLEKKYLLENMTISELVELTGKTKYQIKGALRRYGLRKKPLKLGSEQFDNEEWLYNEYIIKQKGYTVIAKQCGVSYTTILDRIHHFGWDIRTHRDIDKGLPRRGKKHTPKSIALIKSTRVKKRISIKCKYCKKNVTIHHSSYKKSNIHFCSQNCFRKYLFINRVETKDITDSAAYKNWRLKVYKRDGYRCKMPACNSDSRNIAAHHIYPKRKFPNLQFDINNGITLCKICHEKTYGKEMQFVNALVRVIQTMNG